MLELSDIVNFLNNNVGLLIGAGLPLLLLIAVTLTWMSGILASLDRLTFLRAGLIVLIESAVCLLATFIVVSSVIPDVVSFSFQSGFSFKAPATWTKTGIGAGAIAAIDLALLWLLLTIFAGASVWATIKAWIIRALLYVMLVLLLAGIGFVGMSIAQVARSESSRDPLMWFGIVVGGGIGVIVILYFVVTALRSRAR